MGQVTSDPATSAPSAIAQKYKVHQNASFQKKKFPPEGPTRMFPRPRCGFRRACLRHSHEFASVVIPVTLKTYRVVHVAYNFSNNDVLINTFLTHANYFIGHSMGV